MPAGQILQEGARDLWRCRHTMVATLAHAIKSLSPERLPAPTAPGSGEGGRWCVWVVGCREEVEGRLAKGGWLVEPLQVLCPENVHGWQFELIGPEMDEWQLEIPATGVSSPSATSPAAHIIRGHHALVHELPAAACGTADLLVAFHCGIGSLLLPLVAPWLPSLERLLGLRVPLLLTSYHKGESDGEEQLLLQAMGAKALTRAADCPLRHPVPVDALEARDPEARDPEARDRELEARAPAFASAEAAAKTEAHTAASVTRFARAAAEAEATRLRISTPQPLLPLEATAEADEAMIARAGPLYEWHNNPEALQKRAATCNSRFWWVCGGDGAGGASARGTQMARNHTILFGHAKLDQWMGGIAHVAKAGSAAPRAIFEEACIYAELFAEATTEPRLAARAAANNFHLILKLCAFVADRAAAVPRDERRHGQRSYDGAASTYARFGEACRRALERVEAAASSSGRTN